MGKDAGVDVDHTVTTRSRHHLLLSRGNHRVQVFGLVLEHLNEFDQATVADVQRAVKFEHSGVALRVLVEFGDVLGADEYGSILVVWIDRRHHADTYAIAFREVPSLYPDV